MSFTQRIIINAKDIMVISKCCLTTAYRTLNKIKIVEKKPKTGLVSLQEYCKYRGLSEELVLRMFEMKPSRNGKIDVEPDLMEKFFKQQSNQN